MTTGVFAVAVVALVHTARMPVTISASPRSSRHPTRVPPAVLARPLLPHTAGDSTDDSAGVARPERPTVATHAYTVAPGYVETEGGGQYTIPHGGGKRRTDVPVLVKFGVPGHVQLDLITGYTSAPAGAGVTDAAVGVKWTVTRTSLAVLAVQGTLKLPTASTATVGSGTTDASFLMIASRSVGALDLDVNVGVTRRTGDGTRVPRSATLWTVSTGWPLSDRVGWVTELYGNPGTSGPSGAPPSVGLLFGPTLTVRPQLVLDAGAVLDVSRLGSNSMYAGVTWNVGHW